MFSLLPKDGKLALRLPTEAREEFLKKYKTVLATQYGTVLREYVEVPDAMLKSTRDLKKYFDISYAYAQSLRAKPTTRKKKPT